MSPCLATKARQQNGPQLRIAFYLISPRSTGSKVGLEVMTAGAQRAVLSTACPPHLEHVVGARVLLNPLGRLALVERRRLCQQVRLAVALVALHAAHAHLPRRAVSSANVQCSTFILPERCRQPIADRMAACSCRGNVTAGAVHSSEADRWLALSGCLRPTPR